MARTDTPESSKEPTEGGPTAFCPACWRTLPARETRCPDCGAEIEALSSRPYAAKLLAALEHPIEEVRERAARILGEVGSPETLKSLMRIAVEDRDPYLAAVALRSLERLLERFPDLPSIDWTKFAGRDRPIIVRVTAIEIHRRRSGEAEDESARARRFRGEIES